MRCYVENCPNETQQQGARNVYSDTQIQPHAGTKEKLIQQVQEGLVPRLDHVPGFRAYFLLDVADNEVAIISTFDTLADAKAAARLAEEWVAEYARPFIQGGSKIVAGQVRVQQYQEMRATTQTNPFRRQGDWV